MNQLFDIAVKFPRKKLKEMIDTPYKNKIKVLYENHMSKN